MKEQLPPTTEALLNAVGKCGEIRRVCIRAQQIEYFPCRTRLTGERIEAAGISDLVQLFVNHSTSKKVAHHFRIGSYDLTSKLYTMQLSQTHESDLPLGANVEYKGQRVKIFGRERDQKTGIVQTYWVLLQEGKRVNVAAKELKL